MEEPKTATSPWEERPAPWAPAAANGSARPGSGPGAPNAFAVLAAALFAGGLCAFVLLAPSGAPPASLEEPAATAPVALPAAVPRPPVLLATSGWEAPVEQPELVAFVPEPARPLVDLLQDRRPDLSGLLARAEAPRYAPPRVAAPPPAYTAFRPVARLRPLPSLSGFPVSGLDGEPAPAAPRTEGSASIDAPRVAPACSECGGAAVPLRLGQRYVDHPPGSVRIRVQFIDLGTCNGKRVYGVQRANSERSTDLLLTANSGESWQLRGLRPGEMRRIVSDRPISGMNVDDL